MNRKETRLKQRRGRRKEQDQEDVTLTIYHLRLNQEPCKFVLLFPTVKSVTNPTPAPPSAILPVPQHCVVPRYAVERGMSKKYTNDLRLHNENFCLSKRSLSQRKQFEEQRHQIISANLVSCITNQTKFNANKLFQLILSLYKKGYKRLAQELFLQMLSPGRRQYHMQCQQVISANLTDSIFFMFFKEAQQCFFYGELTPFWCLPNTRCCQSPRMNFTFTILASSTIFWWDHGFAPLHTEAHCLVIQPNLVSVNYDAMDTDYCVVLTSVVRTTGL